MRESGKKRRTAHFRNAPLPSRLRRATFPGGEGGEGKLFCCNAPEIIL